MDFTCGASGKPTVSAHGWHRERETFTRFPRCSGFPHAIRTRSFGSPYIARPSHVESMRHGIEFRKTTRWSFGTPVSSSSSCFERLCLAHQNCRRPFFSLENEIPVSHGFPSVSTPHVVLFLKTRYRSVMPSTSMTTGAHVPQTNLFSVP